MGLATYTLSADGQATSNTGGDILAEWWTLTPEVNVGAGYQVQASISQDETNPGSVIGGVFEQWVSLSEGRTWSLDSPTLSDGVLILIRIRDAFTREIKDSATIELGII